MFVFSNIFDVPKHDTDDNDERKEHWAIHPNCGTHFVSWIHPYVFGNDRNKKTLLLYG